MVKETKYRHHPVRIENGLYMGSQQLDILGARLQFLDEVLKEDGAAESTGWLPLDLISEMPTGETVPRDAIAVILDVEVWDDVAGNHYMEFASAKPDANTSNQNVPAGRTETVYAAQGAGGRKGSRTIVVELSEDFRILTKITASGPNAFNYSINLIGWLIGGTRVAKVTFPSSDLYAKFMI